MDMDYILFRLDRWLDGLPAHLVALSSVGLITFGLWVIGHQLGVL